MLAFAGGRAERISLSSGAERWRPGASIVIRAVIGGQRQGEAIHLRGTAVFQNARARFQRGAGGDDIIDEQNAPSVEARASSFGKAEGGDHILAPLLAGQPHLGRRRPVAQEEAGI